MGAAKGREIGIKSKCHAQPQEEREMAIGMDHNGSWWGDLGEIAIYLPPFSSIFFKFPKPSKLTKIFTNIAKSFLNSL